MLETESAIFQENLARYIARRQTRVAMPSTLSETKIMLSEQRQQLVEHPIILSLTHQLMTPDQRVLELTEEIYHQVNEKYKIKGFGIIIMGSNAHGGAAVGHLAHRETSPDLDFNLISSDYRRLKKNRGEIRNNVKRLILKLRSDFNLSYYFQSCTKYAAEDILNNLSSVNDTKQFLLKSPDQMDPSFFHYFYPSIPRDLNQKNMNYIAQALRNIFKDNPEEFENVKNKLIENWNSLLNHILRYKHLGYPRSASEERLAYKIVEDSVSSMAEPFVRFIDSTKDVPMDYTLANSSLFSRIRQALGK